LAGAVNSVAGGGTLLTFPALFAALGSTATAAVVANATSTVALVPGSAAAMWGYRRELHRAARWAWLLLPPSVLGGLVGSLLVARLPPETFELLVPWLILTAALLFAAQPAVSRWLGIGEQARRISPRRAVAVAFLQLLIAIYGGYFGAGIGILMLSGLALMGLSDIHAMNGLKTLLNCAINGISVAIFIQAGLVYWPLALSMAAAAIAGGYAGARIARRLDRNLVRSIVVVIGIVLSLYYFYHQATAGAARSAHRRQCAPLRAAAGLESAGAQEPDGKLRPALKRQVGQRFPQRGREFESMPGEAGNVKNLVVPWMAIRDKVSIGRQRIHANGMVG
jgi:hypothetical protein